MKESVKTALIDLELFIEVSDKKDVDQVITQETLKPVVEALLWYPLIKPDKPDMKRAEIAQLFIQVGFNYLSAMKPASMTSSHHRTKDDAIDLSYFLVDAFKPENERRYTGYVSSNTLDIH